MCVCGHTQWVIISPWTEIHFSQYKKLHAINSLQARQYFKSAYTQQNIFLQRFNASRHLVHVAILFDPIILIHINFLLLSFSLMVIDMGLGWQLKHCRTSYCNLRVQFSSMISFINLNTILFDRNEAIYLPQTAEVTQLHLISCWMDALSGLALSKYFVHNLISQIY